MFQLRNLYVQVLTRRRRTALFVSYHCLVFVRIGNNAIQCLSTVRILSVFSARSLSVRILSISILSGFSKKLSVVCLPGRTRMGQRCPDFRCPCPLTSGYNIKRKNFKLLGGRPSCPVVGRMSVSAISVR